MAVPLYFYFSVRQIMRWEVLYFSFIMLRFLIFKYPLYRQYHYGQICSVNHLKSPILSTSFNRSLSYFSSVSSNRPWVAPSMSKTPITYPSWKMGITISDFDTGLQATCPSNFSTSARTIDFLLVQAQAHTPLPLKSFAPAGGPWNCPRDKYSDSVFLFFTQ